MSSAELDCQEVSVEDKTGRVPPGPVEGAAPRLRVSSSHRTRAWSARQGRYLPSRQRGQACAAATTAGLRHSPEGRVCQCAVWRGGGPQNPRPADCVQDSGCPRLWGGRPCVLIRRRGGNSAPGLKSLHCREPRAFPKPRTGVTAPLGTAADPAWEDTRLSRLPCSRPLTHSSHPDCTWGDLSKPEVLCGGSGGTPARPWLFSPGAGDGAWARHMLDRGCPVSHPRTALS